jgi:hypothetical protein
MTLVSVIWDYNNKMHGWLLNLSLDAGQSKIKALAVFVHGEGPVLA